MTDKKNSIAIIGVGKVGTALGCLLSHAGHSICAISDQSNDAIKRAQHYIDAKSYSISSLASANADCFIIAAIDDAIASVCSDLSNAGILKPGLKVVHVSGAGGLDVLHAASQCGASVASIHPVQSFADVETAIKNIPGSVFGITANSEINDWCVSIVKDLGGIPVFISDNDKPLYHAAACMASNYLAALLFMVTDFYQNLGMKDEDCMQAYLPLVRGTLSNIQAHGPVAALTGPIARGDMGTIEKHLKVIEDKLPQYLGVYKQLALITLDVALLKGSITQKKAQAMKKMLKED